MRTPSDRCDLYSCCASTAYVEHGVADVYRLLGRDLQAFQRTQHRVRVWLVPLGIVCRDDCIDEVVQLQLRQAQFEFLTVFGGHQADGVPFAVGGLHRLHCFWDYALQVSVRRVVGNFVRFHLLVGCAAQNAII